jgi:membrane protease YdiL (CAAX protease family)
VSKATLGILVYLGITFVLAWVLWLIPMKMHIPPQSPSFQLAVAPGTFAPAVAAFIVRKWATGEGFGDAGLRFALDRFPYYAFALLIPLVVVAAIMVLASALGVSTPDFTLKRGLAVLRPSLVHQTTPPPLAVLVVNFLISSVLLTPLYLGEEFGWRGYLQIRLLADRPALAAVATGLIWGVWHYPLVLLGYQYPDRPQLGLAVMPVSGVMLSIFFGWLQSATGSVWTPSLAHSATNILGGSLVALLYMGGPNWIHVNYLGTLGWVPFGILCAWILLTGRL